MSNLQESEDNQKTTCEKCGRAMHRARGCLYCGSPRKTNNPTVKASTTILNNAQSNLILDETESSGSGEGLDRVLMILSMPVYISAIILWKMGTKSNWFRAQSEISPAVLFAHSLLIGVFAFSLQFHWGTPSPPPFFFIYIISFISLWARHFRNA